MKLNILLVVFVTVSLTIISGFTGYYILTKAQEGKTFNVTKVIDGDTIEIETGQTVRLLGINAPEKNEHYYKEAKDYLSKLILNKNVKLETNSDDIDKYGRLLRYVFVGGNFANFEMVKGGYATVYVLNPAERYYPELKNAEKEAKESNKRLWNASQFSKCINITEFHYTGDEYVKLSNSCSYSIKMDKWEIKDEATHIYVLKAFVFNPDSSFTLFTGYGNDTPDKLYWNSKTAIWNNAGDTLFLRDDRGNLVLSYSYP